MKSENKPHQEEQNGKFEERFDICEKTHQRPRVERARETSIRSWRRLEFWHTSKKETTSVLMCWQFGMK